MSISKKRVLDLAYAQEICGKTIPCDLFAQNQNINRIGDLDKISSLRKLDISFNPLTSLNGASALSQLRQLHSYSCRLINIDDVSHMPYLETLMLQQNDLSKLNESLLQLKKLRELRLDHNKITTIECLNNCTSLRTLDLSWVTS